MTRLWTALSVVALVGMLGAAPAVGQDKAAGQEKAAAKAKAAPSPAAPVNINTATQAQLESLPGVGPAAAKRIIEHREKNGAFKKVEELMNVKGIGEKSFLKLKPLITVSAGERQGTL